MVAVLKINKFIVVPVFVAILIWVALLWLEKHQFGDATPTPASSEQKNAFVESLAKTQGKKEKPLLDCNQYDIGSLGSIFYDFDALIIYYRDFMWLAGSHWHAKEFPEALKNKTFNDRLLKAIKKNFSLCLKTPDGKDKPIYVIYTRPLGNEGCDGDTIKCEPSYEQKEMTRNPRNLTLILRGHYAPTYEIAPGIKGIGYIHSYWFRPEASYFKHQPWPSTVSIVTSFLPPVNGIQTVEEALESNFFPLLVPRKSVGPRSDLVSPVQD